MKKKKLKKQFKAICKSYAENENYSYLKVYEEGCHAVFFNKEMSEYLAGHLERYMDSIIFSIQQNTS